MQLSEFDYDLPEDLIAQAPLEQRDASRMLVVDRKAGNWRDDEFRSFPDYVQQNDVVVVNNTRVFPARLIGQRDPSGGRVEVLLTREIEPTIWEGLVRPAQRMKIGSRLRFGSDLHAEVLDWSTSALRQLKFDGPLEPRLDTLGQTPLPPYIKRTERTAVNDRERYQTVFARERGAIAAPTAGLHFTPQSQKALIEGGATIAEITLHVGYGTFEPVRVEDIDDHMVAAEFFEIREEAATAINQSRAAGGRVIAIGTTTTRALETAVDESGTVCPAAKETELTILPGHRFRVTDALLTNFHLPRSSLLLLVSAFGGRELILEAYRHAVNERYRFYSYGDCMLVI
ncbi:MAG TPA: tRNA preQ1(34) S-adenosylmethionine ribosyltransferase-isomerase QueA [Pyrinomonadaceae bacterium]|nr:tRNA preQ1(34) S-adenosylmethionine ribosyltransferase-isomerase QueA [Pyrinomonadaceae bacterium]